jgi:hypothetical protein
MRYLYIVFILFVFYGCSFSDAKPDLNKTSLDIYDLKHIPQDVDVFTKKIVDAQKLYEVQKEFDKHYFKVWRDDFKVDALKDSMWAFDSYRFGNSYGENLNLLEKEFFTFMRKNANFKNYTSINRYAITTKNLNIRAFPTIKPLLRDPTQAGEGFPFDYLQNSTIYINKPLFVSHYSKDRAWVFVFSSFTSGWVKTNGIAFVDAQKVKQLQKQRYASILKDADALYDEAGNFICYAKIGMRFPIISQDAQNYIVEITGLGKRVKISKSIATDKPLILNKNNINLVMKSIFKTKYGWGGLYGDRDCSSTLRDLFAPFGIWLPRNSSKQAQVGRVISLENLSDDEKISIIKEKAIPFQTLLYKRGHILLYVGTYDKKVIVFHNTWGIKTKKDGVEGRFIIGKTIFSTLKLGEYLKDYDVDAQLLKNIKSINIITH